MTSCVECLDSHASDHTITIATCPFLIKTKLSTERWRARCESGSHKYPIIGQEVAMEPKILLGVSKLSTSYQFHPSPKTFAHMLCL